jgi:aminobenzoyl-glutamate utilization protein B
MSIGNKGMMVAAKTMTLAMMELFQNPEHLARAREEFTRRLNGFVYVPKIGDRAPPLDYRK